MMATSDMERFLYRHNNKGLGPIFRWPESLEYNNCCCMYNNCCCMHSYEVRRQHAVLGIHYYFDSFFLNISRFHRSGIDRWHWTINLSLIFNEIMKVKIMENWMVSNDKEIS